MNWEAIGAVGEVIGAVAVVATLMYLALQVREAKHATRADVGQRLADELAKLNRDVYTNSEFAQLISRAYAKLSFSELQPDEQQRLGNYFASVLNRINQILELKDMGIVDERTSEESLRYLDGFIGRPIFVATWKSALRSWYPERFVEFIDTRIARKDVDDA